MASIPSSVAVEVNATDVNGGGGNVKNNSIINNVISIQAICAHELKRQCSVRFQQPRWPSAAAGTSQGGCLCMLHELAKAAVDRRLCSAFIQIWLLRVMGRKAARSVFNA